jgi:hypothetical protein
MTAFVKWVETFPRPRMFVAHPLIFDGPWVDHNLAGYTNKRLFAYAGHAEALFEDGGLDLPSLAMGTLRLPFAECRRERPPDCSGSGGTPIRPLMMHGATPCSCAACSAGIGGAG